MTPLPKVRGRRPAKVAAGAVLAVALAGVVAACGSSSSADSASGGSDMSLVAYSTPGPAYTDSLIPAFQKTSQGSGAHFSTSFGASGDQSRAVESGQPASVVHFSILPDMERLVDDGIVDKSWDQNPYHGFVEDSVVTFVVRKGNPKGITSWDDLVKPGVEVVTPNPFSSGSAKWNLLAPYAAKSNGGADKAAGLAYVSALVKDHVKVQPKSGREATETFLQGSGDVLLSYENEALFVEKNGDPVQHVTPPTTFKIENPAAVLKGSKNLATATAFDDYLYTPEAQKLLAQAGFRPVDATVAQEYASTFPAPTKLWTIADLGGWKTVDSTLFQKDVGDIARIYDQATQ
jgi:sulfate/thiosulfate transport system substrate-binding protein